MAKNKKNRLKRRGTGSNAGQGNVHPLIVQAISNGARQDGTLEVTEVANPYGEVIIRGEMRRHKAVRRVPHFETLYRSKVIDRHVFVCLEWYAARLGLAQSGLIKCGLDVSGSGGGSAFHHIPTTEAAAEARSDVDMARRFVPDNDLRRVFVAVMEKEMTFEQAGAEVYAHVCFDRAKRKASSAFKIAANHLLAGIGHKVPGGTKEHVND